MPFHSKVDGDRLDGQRLAVDPLRVVVRNGHNRDIADMFLEDLTRLVPRLEKQPSPAHDESYTSFSH